MNQIKIEDILPKLLEVLPLPDGVTAETVTADQINAALDSLISEEQVEDYENRIKELNNRVKAGEQFRQIAINRDLETLGISDADERKTLAATLEKAEDYDATIAVLIKNRGTAATTGTVRQPVHNRKDAGTPGSVAEPDAQAEAQAKRISNRAAELKKTLGISHTEAFSRARAEIEAVKS